MEDILQRIRESRKKKGFSYDTMAHELNTSTAAYRKIELNQTKLTVERLYQISQVLETKLEDLLDLKSDKIYKQEIKENSIGCQDIEHFYAENKEKSEKIEQLYEARIQDKDNMILQLQGIIANISK
jgi:transcriptional regulator with XRE-family HTH domain